MLLNPVMYFYFFGNLGLGVALIWITVNIPQHNCTYYVTRLSLCFNLTAGKDVVILNRAFYIFHSSLEVSLSTQIFNFLAVAFCLVNPALLYVFDQVLCSDFGLVYFVKFACACALSNSHFINSSGVAKTVNKIMNLKDFLN